MPSNQPRIPNNVKNPFDIPTILFCGKHRVNYAVFAPIHRMLSRNPELKVLISSGAYRCHRLIGWTDPNNPRMRNETLFKEFGIDPSCLCKTGSSDRKFYYEVYVSSNSGERIMPRYCGTKVQIFVGVSFRNYAVNAKYLHFDKLFFPGRYMMEQFVERGILREDDPRIEIMGLPKLDRLVDGSIDRRTILEQYGLDPTIPTVLWCPTGAHYNSYEKLGHAGLRAVQDLGYNLIVKLHDHPHLMNGQTQEALNAHVREGLGPNGRLVVDSDVVPLMVAADLLISDASSVAFEYCLLDRPIIFVDVPELLEARAAMADSAMDLDSHGRKIGHIVRNAQELGKCVREALDDPGFHSAERQAAAQHLFHNPGLATQRVADRLYALACAARR